MSKTELVAVAGTKDEQRKGDIVFVHGLDGDSRLTWQFEDDESSFWPQLLYNDLPDFGVWSFGYDSASSKWFGTTMPIVDRATNLAAFLRSDGIGGRPVFFVVHSLGGLIVKQMLRSLYDQNHDDHVVQNTKCIFFFGTPHMGSKLSNFIQLLGLSRPSVSVEELEHADSHLRDLNLWYRRNAPMLGVGTVVFSETQAVKNAVLVVDQVSSDPGIANVVPIPVDCDHVELCKVATDSMPYKTVRNRIQEYGRESEKRISIKEESDIWVDVSCFNKYPDQWEEKNKPKNEQHTLHYEVDRTDGKIAIQPDTPYMTHVLDGEPVWSIDYMWLPFRWLPVTLDIKLLNRGNAIYYLSRLELLVEKSRPDYEPIPFVKSSAFPNLSIKNDGWGYIESANLRLAFADGIGRPDFPEVFPNEVAIPKFEPDCMNGGFGIETEESFVDLTDHFRAEGVDVDAVLRGNPTAELGRFKSGRAFVYGLLTLKVVGVGERVFKFGTSMRLGRPLMGMYGPPSFEYQAKLKTEGDNYIVAVEMSHTLNRDETDRLLVQLDADQSSNHLMRLRFCGSGPNIDVETPVEVCMVVPRSIAGKLREPSAADGFE